MFKKILKFTVFIFLVLIVLGAIGKNISKDTEKGNAPENAPESQRDSTATQSAPSQKPVQYPTKSKEIIIGIEYALQGEDAVAFGKLGIAAVKPLPEAINWSKMQPDIDGPINYSVADQFVKEYQNAGFRELVIGLRTLSHADDNKATYGKDRPVPKPEYQDAYADWIRSFVERYDKDGVGDMPGLKYPVRYYEIEVEFSSYTPEPVLDYVEKLKIAYEAAHGAYSDVLVAHSAFLAMTAFDSNPSAGQYEKAFASMRIPDKHHNLADMRKVLDHPELFDRVNMHELGDPIMIERTVQWLVYEMDRRGYEKPIIISDTAPTPFVSYGRATSCTGPFLGIVIWPAQESDRCRLADYFNNILDNDVATVAWKNWYIAADMVKKVVVAAASGVELIDTAFTGDLPILNTKLGFASAGNGGFGGVVSETYNFVAKKYTVTEYRPGFYALQQLAETLQGVESVRREPSDAEVRLYALKNQQGTFWIGWVHPNYLVLPGDSEPTKSVMLNLPSGAKVVSMATTGNAEKAVVLNADKGKVNVHLTMTPVYIFEKSF
jgi:hypothetical protein